MIYEGPETHLSSGIHPHCTELDLNISKEIRRGSLSFHHSMTHIDIQDSVKSQCF